MLCLRINLNTGLTFECVIVEIFIIKSLRIRFDFRLDHYTDIFTLLLDNTKIENSSEQTLEERVNAALKPRRAWSSRTHP